MRASFLLGMVRGYSQKDLDQLSQYIEEVDGVNISLSTLKRVWKNDFKSGPQTATLNSLARILEYKGWQDFKLQNRLRVNSTGKDSVGSSLIRSEYLRVGLILMALVIGVACLISYTRSKESVVINGPVLFSADKTITEGVPNTVIFNYDVSSVSADSFFIQQSWNRWRRRKIDSNQRIYSSIYYESGYHRAKLIANDSIIARLPIHILSDGWEPHMYYSESDDRFIDFTNESFEENSQLHLPLSLLEKKGIDMSRSFYTRISNSKDFNISSDNFHFSTRFKLDTVTSSNCPWLRFQIVTEKHIFYVNLVQKGCELFATYKIGEIVRKGETANLAGLGQNVFDWQEVDIEVQNRQAIIRVNGDISYRELFTEDFGQIMGIAYLFDGTGSIDNVYLSDIDSVNVYKDDFDRN